MSAQSSLTLNTKVYTPRGTQNGVSTWALAGDTTFGGATSVLTESVRGPLSSGATRSRFLLTVPKVASVDSPCACIGSDIGKGTANVVVDIPSSFTAAERLDLVLRIQAFVASPVFTAAVQNLEGSWS